MQDLYSNYTASFPNSRHCIDLFGGRGDFFFCQLKRAIYFFFLFRLNCRCFCQAASYQNWCMSKESGCSWWNMWVMDLFCLVKSPLCNLWGLSSPKSSKVTPARHCLANYLKLFCFCWSFGRQPVKYDSELCFYNIIPLGMRQTAFPSQCKRHLPLYHHEHNIKQLLSTAFWRHFCHWSAEFNKNQI